jgi:hypothetical protein
VHESSLIEDTHSSVLPVLVIGNWGTERETERQRGKERERERGREPISPRFLFVCFGFFFGTVV